MRLIGNHSDYLRPSGYLVRVACQVQGPGAVHDLTAARTWGTQRPACSDATSARTPCLSRTGTSQSRHGGDPPLVRFKTLRTVSNLRIHEISYAAR